MTATHPRKEALDLLAREVAPAGTSWAPGTTGSGSGRAVASPSIRQFSFLLDKSKLMPMVTVNGGSLDVAQPSGQALPTQSVADANRSPADTVNEATDLIEVPLIRIAYARSGDKGDTSNTGVIARRPEWLPTIRAQVTESTVATYLAHLVEGHVTRWHGCLRQNDPSNDPSNLQGA